MTFSVKFFLVAPSFYSRNPPVINGNLHSIDYPFVFPLDHALRTINGAGFGWSQAVCPHPVSRLREVRKTQSCVLALRENNSVYWNIRSRPRFKYHMNYISQRFPNFFFCVPLMIKNRTTYTTHIGSR